VRTLKTNTKERAKHLETTTKETSVVLIDDHAVVRSGFKALLSTNDDINVIGDADSVTEGIKLVEALNPEVAVLDLRLPDGSGLDVARWIAKNNSTTRCIVLTSVPTDRAMVAAFASGAVSAFLTKESQIEGLTHAIRDVAQGKTLFDGFSARAAAARLEAHGYDHLDKLSIREREMADLVADGFSDEHIASTTCSAVSTVRNNLSSAYAKLSIDSRTQLSRIIWLSRMDDDVI